MITREEISILLDHPVYDGDGNKIGDAKHVFLDDASGRPEWVTVKTGMFGSSESFIPIRDASMVQDHLEVPYPKDKVKGAPSVDIDAGGHLSVDEEHRLYEYYGINWDNVLTDPKDTDTATGKAGTAGAARRGRGRSGGRRGHGGRGDRTPRRHVRHLRCGRHDGHAGRHVLRGRAKGTTAERSGAAGAMSRRGEAGARHERRDDALRGAHARRRRTPRERPGTPAQVRGDRGGPADRPVRHEEVRVEREPITDANRQEAMSGPSFKEDQHEVTLHEERPVVSTEAVPVERVRMTTEEKVTNETVRGRVRKERIEAETEMTDESGRKDRGDTPGRGRDMPGRDRER